MEKDKIRVGMLLQRFLKRLVFKFFLNEEREVVEHTLSGKSFQNFVASYYLRPKCLVDLYTNYRQSVGPQARNHWLL